MKDFQKLLRQSVVQHQRLHDRLRAIEKRLPILDLESTVQAADDMDALFTAIQLTDQQILTVMDAEIAAEHSDLIEERLQLGKTLQQQYQMILPKLKTRLAGYKAELFKIKHGLQTMGGYTHGATAAGSIIDTSN